MAESRWCARRRRRLPITASGAARTREACIAPVIVAAPVNQASMRLLDLARGRPPTDHDRQVQMRIADERTAPGLAGRIRRRWAGTLGPSRASGIPPDLLDELNTADPGAAAYRRRSLPLDEGWTACAALRPCTERRQRKLARPRSREADQACYQGSARGIDEARTPFPSRLPPAPRRWFLMVAPARPGRYPKLASSTSSSAGSHARCNSKSTCERPTSDRPPRSRRRCWLAGADPDLLDRVTRRMQRRSSSNAVSPR